MKKKNNKNLLFWAIFAAFAVAAVAVEWHQQITAFSGGLGIAKLFVWAAFFLFVAISATLLNKSIGMGRTIVDALAFVNSPKVPR